MFVFRNGTTTKVTTITMEITTSSTLSKIITIATMEITTTITMTRTAKENDNVHDEDKKRG